MKKLLIHNQKTIIAQPEVFAVTEQYAFQSVDDSLGPDRFILNSLKKGEDLFEKILKADILFIRLSLSDNYLEYLGLRLAYHIRMCLDLDTKNLMPIVLVCEESFQFIGRTSDLPDILFSEGIYLIKDTLEAFKNAEKMFSEGKLVPLSNLEAMIRSVRIPAPANYSSRHSLANEWCVLRWAEMANNFDEIFIKDLKESNPSTNTLYFNHLELKYKFETDKKTRQKFKNSTKQNLKILFEPDKKIYYIDDEVGKGWGKLFKEGIFKEFSDKGAFAYFDGFKKGDDKTLQKSDLLSRLPDLINQEGFSVFIVDLRLFDDDFSHDQEPSGFEIIREIKKINPGVQVVIFTASKNAENMLKAQELRTAGYVIKESPENLLNRAQSWDVFVKFAQVVKFAMRFTYLTKLHDLIAKLRSSPMFGCFSTGDKLEFKDAFIGRNGFLDRLVAMIDARDELLIASAFHASFAMLEKFCKVFHKTPTEDIGLVNTFTRSLEYYRKESATQASSTLLLKQGDLGYEKNPDGKTFVGVEFFASPQRRTFSKRMGNNTALAHLLATLHHRFGLADDKLDRMVEMTYLRNQLTGHDTGAVDLGKKIIGPDELTFILEVLEEVFTSENTNG
jgi:CheY-like chemotaxis protein